MKKILPFLLLACIFQGFSQNLESEPAWYLESIEVDGNLIPVPVNSENLEIQIRFYFDYDIFVFESDRCYYMNGFYSDSNIEVTFDNIFIDSNSNCALNDNSDFSQLYTSLFENNITYTYFNTSNSEGRALEIIHPNGNILNYRSTPLGIHDAVNIEINILPNPAGDFIQLQGNNIDIKKVAIFNEIGQMVIQQTNPEKLIDVSGLSEGLYFIEFTSEGKKSILKFIKN